MSRMALKLAPRASHVQTCLRLYAGWSWPASHVSSSGADRERIGVIGQLLYRRFESTPTLAHHAVVDELAKVSAHRHLRGDQQLLVEVAVDAAGQIGRAHV